jgi:predicted ATPase
LAERGEANRVARQHAKFFSEFLQNDQFVQSRFGEHDLSGYAAHIGNVRAALQWAFSDDGDVSVGVELAAWAAPLFIGLSLLEDCGRWCETALAGLDVAAARGTRQEMILQEALALSLMYVSGNIDQVRVAIERGLALHEALSGDRWHKLRLLFGMYRLLLRLADFQGALTVAQQSAAFAEATEDPAGLLIADYMLGTCHHFIGDQAAAQFYSERAMARAARPGASIPIFFGFDQRVGGPLTLARTLWFRGFPEQACRLVKSSFVDELLSGVHPLTACAALSYGSPVFLWSGDFRTVDGNVARLIDYAGRHSLETFRVCGLGLKGALAVARDELAHGIDVLRAALEILMAKDRNLYPLGLFMGALADGLRKSGQLEEALLTINQAIDHATDCGLTFDMAELLRIKAQILAAMAQYGRDAARNCLTEALAVAKAQSALALELRVTIALAGLLAEGGQRDQARHDLALVYGRFTEGFETSDLRIARRLIQDLA